MERTATPADAELILKLYDLRREPTMREARKWYTSSFWPEKMEDVMKVFTDFASAENAYFRQVTSYWTMAASLVQHGALNSALFLDNSGEMLLVYMKLKPFLAQMRQVMNAPDFMATIEKVAESTEKGRAQV